MKMKRMHMYVFAERAPAGEGKICDEVPAIYMLLLQRTELFGAAGRLAMLWRPKQQQQQQPALN